MAKAAPREFGKDGKLRMTVGEIERAFHSGESIKIRDLRDSSTKLVKIEKFADQNSTAFHLLNNPMMVLTAESEEGVLRLKYSMPGINEPEKNIWLKGADCIDLKATIVQ